MDKTFMIIDDDVNVRKMLAILIRKNRLGKVLTELDSGKHAAQEILFFNPDIVLIDLLLPAMDGIEVINEARSKGYKGKFIMISQVEDENMVAKAYESGILFFINKPINNIEVVSVIKGVCRIIDLENSLALIKNTVMNYDAENHKIKDTNDKNIETRINKIFSDLGIIGVAGSNELLKVIYTVHELKLENPNAEYQLQDIYEKVLEEDDDNIEKLNVKSLEQRVRRTIQKALQTLAELGLSDFDNDIFLEYSTLLFDFKQVRQQMRHIENPKEEPGKINIKKFIEGIIAKLRYSQ
ncbi:DNA-binding domain-containing protein [Thermosediminibacter oceani]|uniref:Stage 0 sporulation protein A homolog n=1 Tax=Thermosediminibacter oceani (strain ATCC BAA-1034 / DSM 16646 / JW/IW-1228P) TaxID=555079 RepID=D9S1G0_THEOJ|nr:DNA-binding domain-containing protein [Thermosediminibacter oceani]ADL07237.1 response regulator receiver protein [Thermosediminibacter oceani DSM 16646]